MSEALPAADASSGLAGTDGLAFRVDGVDHRWADVFAHASRRGDWRILETEVRQAMACRRLAIEEGAPLGREAERSVAVAFRRARRLHAAEDLEAWLTAHGLTVAQWRRYIQGEALRRRHAADLDTVVARYPADEAVRAALGPWGWCSGAFPRWAEQLAARVAAAHATCEHADERPPGPDDLAELEGLYDRFAAEVASDERRTALLATRYLDWLQIDGETAVFADQDTAAEALLCVRDDGWSLAEATQAGRGQLRRQRLLGSLPLGGEPAPIHVLRKDAPSLDDGQRRGKASRQPVTTAATCEVDERVEWLRPR